MHISLASFFSNLLGGEGVSGTDFPSEPDDVLGEGTCGVWAARHGVATGCEWIGCAGTFSEACLPCNDAICCWARISCCFSWAFSLSNTLGNQLKLQSSKMMCIPTRTKGTDWGRLPCLRQCLCQKDRKLVIINPIRFFSHILR